MLISAAVILICCNFLQASPRGYKTKTIKIVDQQIEVYVADTPLKKETGLAAFDQISENQGMIFPFEDESVRTFWMKDMKFAIDIVWIRDNTIIGIDENARPEVGESDGQLIRYRSVEPSDTVIEVNAGWTGRNGAKIGDKIYIK